MRRRARASAPRGCVGVLLPEIQAAAADPTASDAWIPLVTQYQDEWAKAIFPPSHGYGGELRHARPSAESLVGLGTFADYLHRTASEGRVPAPEELDEIEHKLKSVIDDVRKAGDLDADLKRELLARLDEVLQAVVFVEIGGPQAAKRAMKALLGAVVILPPEKRRSGFVTNAVAAVAFAWGVFLSGPDIQNSLDAWTEMLQLEPGHTQVVEPDGEVLEAEVVDANEDPDADGGTPAER